MDSFFLGFVSVCVVILGIGLWLLRRADKKAGYTEAQLKESENDAKTLQKQRDSRLNSIDDVDRMFDKWGR